MFLIVNRLRDRVNRNVVVDTESVSSQQSDNGSVLIPESPLPETQLFPDVESESKERQISTQDSSRLTSTWDFGLGFLSDDRYHRNGGIFIPIQKNNYMENIEVKFDPLLPRCIRIGNNNHAHQVVNVNSNSNVAQIRHVNDENKGDVENVESNENQVNQERNDNEASAESNDNPANPERNDNQANPQTSDNEVNQERNDNEANPEKNDNEINAERNDNQVNAENDSSNHDEMKQQEVSLENDQKDSSNQDVIQNETQQGIFFIFILCVN